MGEHNYTYVGTTDRSSTYNCLNDCLYTRDDEENPENPDSDAELKRVLRSVNRVYGISNALSPSPVALAMCFPFIGGRSPSASKDTAAGSKDAAAGSKDAAAAASTWTSTSTLNGEAFAYDDPAKLHYQLRQKERELRKREEENQSLREQLISRVRREWEEKSQLERLISQVRWE